MILFFLLIYIYMIIVATLCYIQKDECTLMLHRNKRELDRHKGYYNGLGGKLEKGESPMACVIREVKEESGLDIIHPRFIGFLTFPFFDEHGNDWHVFVYKAQEFSGQLHETDEGTLEWIQNEDILSLPLWEGDTYFIPYMLSNVFFEGVFEYDQERVLKKWSLITGK